MTREEFLKKWEGKFTNTDLVDGKRVKRGDGVLYERIRLTDDLAKVLEKEWIEAQAEQREKDARIMEARANSWRNENVYKAATDYRRKTTFDFAAEAEAGAAAIRAQGKEKA